MTKKEIDKLPVSFLNLEGAPLSNVKKEEKTCMVCLETFNQGDRVRGLRCIHIFHVDCIDKWLKERSGICPCCRVIQCDKDRLEEPAYQDVDGYRPPANALRDEGAYLSDPED
jgi:hypothetical protein